MISPFLSYKKIFFQSGVAGTSTVYTTVKKSLILVEWNPAFYNSGVAVRARNYQGQTSTSYDFLICTTRAITTGGSLFPITRQVPEGGGGIVPAGKTIQISRTDASLWLHIFELPEDA